MRYAGLADRGQGWPRCLRGRTPGCEPGL